MAATELISLNKDKSDDPRYSVCYARGSSFKKKGHFFQVEKGKRTLVPRALCVEMHFKRRCAMCPNSEFTATFRSSGEAHGA